MRFTLSLVVAGMLVVASAPPAAAGYPRDEPVLPQIAALDADAQAWLLGRAGQQALSDFRARLPKRTQLIVHLPSGRAAGPAPASLSERDDYQLVVVIDAVGAEGKPWHVDVDVTTCGAKDPFRIKGDFSETQEDARIRRGPSPAQHDFQLLPVHTALSCGADRMAYVLTVARGTDKADPVETSWRISPVYHLAATFSAGFDFSRPNAYPVVQQQITETQDTVGLVADVGFTWFPWGVDYEYMRWWNHWVNPFVLFKASAITDGIKIGNAITPAGGISVGIGVAVNKTLILNGSKAGDKLEQGDAPTRSVWKRKGVGLYVGVLFDASLFKALRGLVGAAPKPAS